MGNSFGRLAMPSFTLFAVLGLMAPRAEAARMVQHVAELRAEASAAPKGDGPTALRMLLACQQAMEERRAQARAGAAGTDDILFYPLGLMTALSFSEPGYPTSSVDPTSGTTGGGGTTTGGGRGTPPPVQNAPEPTTLLSGMLGAGLLGLFGWRRRTKTVEQ